MEVPSVPHRATTTSTAAERSMDGRSGYVESAPLQFLIGLSSLRVLLSVRCLLYAIFRTCLARYRAMHPSRLTREPPQRRRASSGGRASRPATGPLGRGERKTMCPLASLLGGLEDGGGGVGAALEGAVEGGGVAVVPAAVDALRHLGLLLEARAPRRRGGVLARLRVLYA
eukprot:gene7392-biopygen5449